MQERSLLLTNGHKQLIHFAALYCKYVIGNVLTQKQFGPHKCLPICQTKGLPASANSESKLSS
jgi:hypothetical protein